MTQRYPTWRPVEYERVLPAIWAANELYYRKAITNEEYAAATSFAQLESKRVLRDRIKWNQVNERRPVELGKAVYVGGWFGWGPVLAACGL